MAEAGPLFLNAVHHARLLRLRQFDFFLGVSADAILDAGEQVGVVVSWRPEMHLFLEVRIDVRLSGASGVERRPT